MICPNCESRQTRVVDTINTNNIVWRMRQCKECGHRFTTSECQDEPLPGQCPARMCCK